MPPSVKPSRVAASPSYAKKEGVRKMLQDLILNSVASGQVTDQAELDEFLGALQMSLEALKMVTYEGFQKLSRDQQGR